MIAGLGRPGRRRGPAAGSRDVDRAAFSLQPLSRRRAPGPAGGYGRRGALRAILRSGVIAQRTLLAAGPSVRPAVTSDGMGWTVASGDGRRPSGNGSGGAVPGSVRLWRVGWRAFRDRGRAGVLRNVAEPPS